MSLFNEHNALFGDNNEVCFVNTLVQLLNDTHVSKKDLYHLAKKFYIQDTTLQKELYETALLLYVKALNLDSSRKSFDKIVEIYNKQISLNLRTSNSVMLQQYSTPIPLAWLAGVYVRHNQTSKAAYFEPSAGNGFLTITLPEKNTTVNEIDKNRRENLANFHKYRQIFNLDGSQDFFTNPYYNIIYFDGIITNPPFGSVSPLEFGRVKRFKISKLEHVMTIHALDTMKDSGRAALIIGGHTEWDSYGKVRNGADRYFLSYLHHYYNVEDVINIKGDMYAKQGTRFPIRLILINGRKAQPEGTAPLKTETDRTVKNWDELWERVSVLLGNNNSRAERLRLANEEAKMMLEILAMEKEVGLSGIPENVKREIIRKAADKYDEKIDLSGTETGKRKTGNYQKIKSLEDLFLCAIYRFPAFYSFGTIDKKAAETVKSRTKIYVKGYELHLDTDHLRHFYDRHYKETDGKHLGIKFSDFQKIIHIIDGFTKVETGKTPDSLVFTKKFTNGIYEIVVIIDSEHKFLFGKSFRINT